MLLLLLLLLMAASASAGSFTCAKPSTCQPAIDYVVPNATTYEQLIFRFRPTTLQGLLAANQLPLDTAARQAIPARTILRIPFRCLCTGDGVGQSDLYTVLTGDGDGEMATAKNIPLAAGYNWRKLPCSCDKVDGSEVMHFAYIVRSGDKSTLEEIAARYGVPESTLLRMNNITNHTSSLREGQILDIPLQGMSTWSRAHYISGYNRRSLLPLGKPTVWHSFCIPGTYNNDTRKDFFADFFFDYAEFKVLWYLAKTVFANNSTRQRHAARDPISVSTNNLDGITLCRVPTNKLTLDALTEGPRLLVLISLVVVAIVLSLLYGTWYYSRSACNSLVSGTTDGVMQFDYNDLAHATDSFSERSMIGEGNFGAVYKATYMGQEVAVKKMKATGKTKDFHDELQAVSNTRHANLVRLKGWCGRVRLIDGKSCWQSQIKIELLLVFELIHNGNLEDHLYNRPDQVLAWDIRYKIVKGIGSALRYLHHECNPCILHRDIKPGNILLDEHFNAKLADFGLSLITSKNRATVVTNAVGTRHYMDPRLQKDGFVEYNRKSDVYSFGLVLLEIACTGKSRDQVWQMRGGSTQQVQVDGVADDRLRGVLNRTELERVVVLGLKCSHLEEIQRPSMEDAMRFLEDGQQLPATTRGEGGYGASCTVNEEEAPMMPHGAGSSC